MDKLLFKAEVRKQLIIRNWSYADLSKHTKYTPDSIKTMLNGNTKMSDRAMENIAHALEIKLE